MKIGILTFHWATNYGAVLQCYALQEYLRSQGHEVEIINYKPKLYDDNAFTFLRFRKFMNMNEYLQSRKKEFALVTFRNSHLYQTKRIYKCKDIVKIANSYDAIISGSDQVANPSFLLSGEGHGALSPTYFLGFPFNGKRIGYALSFGCVTYPEKAREIAARYIMDFNVISVREKTGIDIVKSMGRDDAFLAPDPTLLLQSQFYHTLADECTSLMKDHYIYSFFIRHIADRKQTINNVFNGNVVLWNNEDGNYTMQSWLSKIKFADFVVTDSFHCVVMCLKLHKSFAVVTEQKGNIGMNDRLYTLLDRVNLSNNIIYKEKVQDIYALQHLNIDWIHVDEVLADANNIVNSLFK